MTYHPFVAAQIAGFKTVFLPKAELSGVLDHHIASFAGVPFDTDPEAENTDFNESEYVRLFGPAIHRKVTCVHQLIREKNFTANEILLATFDVDKKSRVFQLLEEEHVAYLDGLKKIIEKHAIFTGNIESVRACQDATDMYEANRHAVHDLYLLNQSDYFDIKPLADKTDADIFAYKTETMMEHAQDRNYVPHSHRHHYRPGTK